MRHGGWKNLKSVSFAVIVVAAFVIFLNFTFYKKLEQYVEPRIQVQQKDDGISQNVESQQNPNQKNSTSLASSSKVQKLITKDYIQYRIEERSHSPLRKRKLVSYNSLKRQLAAEFSYTSRRSSGQKITSDPEEWFDGNQVIPSQSDMLLENLVYLREAKILKAAATEKIGTQLKILLLLEGNVKALFKPKWYPVDYMISGDVYSGKDRHTAEILAFYAGFLLGFRRSPLVAGRIVDLKSEILPVATEELKDTFLTNGTNTCFYGACYYCNKDDYVCAHGEKMEGVVVRWLPKWVKLKSFRSPWARTYSAKKKARWESDPNFCSSYKSNSSLTQRLLDIVDASIFDFIMGNGDRHHLENASGFRNATILLLDNGKSLRDTRDHLDILAPLYQCCIIRDSTNERLSVFQRGQFSQLLAEISSSDQISPLATKDQFDSLDRRLDIVQLVVELCVENHNKEKVVF